MKLSQALIKCGFIQCKTDSCIYVRRHKFESLIIVAVYVDDFLIFYNNGKWKNELKQQLTSQFRMKDLGEVSNILGIRVERNGKTIKLDQQRYIEDILKRFNMSDCNPVKTPADPSQKLTAEMSPTTPEEIAEMNAIPYREAVGSILYLSQCTRPDISFAVGNVSQFNQNPGKAHWNAVKRIFRYLKGTINYKLNYSQDNSSELCAYCDSDWGSNVSDRKSFTGYVYMFQGGPISWSCKKQRTVALSTAEAEYMALSSACQETLWLTQLRSEITGGKRRATIIHCDNKSAIDLSNNAIYSARTKHIDIRHHFIRDLIKDEIVALKSIETGRMIADNLTKAVSIEKHDFCTKEIGIVQ